jgi:hypothetical protein
LKVGEGGATNEGAAVALKVGEGGATKVAAGATNEGAAVALKVGEGGATKVAAGATKEGAAVALKVGEGGATKLGAAVVVKAGGGIAKVAAGVALNVGEGETFVTEGERYLLKSSIVTCLTVLLGRDEEVVEKVGEGGGTKVAGREEGLEVITVGDKLRGPTL